MTNNEVLEYITKSFDLKRQGFYKPAIEMLYKALSIENNNVEILSQLGELYYLLENNQRAINYIEKTLEIDPLHIDCLKLMKTIYMAEEKYDEALKAVNKIYEINPTTENLLDKIVVLNKLNDFEAIKEIENLNVDFDDAIYYNLAQAHYKNQDFKRAIELLEKALERNPENKDAMILLGEVYFSENDLEKSRELFKKLENETENAVVNSYLGLFKMEDGKYEDAINYFHKAMKLDERNSKYVYNLANAYFLNGWIAEAAKFYNIAICLDADNVDYRYSLAYLYTQTREYDKAEKELNFWLNNAIKGVTLDAIVKENPNEDYALVELAHVCVELSQYDLAKKNMEIALEIKPNSLNYLSDYADILIEMANYGEAHEVIEKILSLNENFIEGYILEAKNYIHINDLEGAYDAAQKVIELDTNNAEGYYYNALVLFAQGDVNFAIETMKKAISLDLNNAMYYVQMSEFYQKLGKYEDALAYVSEAASIDGSAKNKELYANLASIVRKQRG